MGFYIDNFKPEEEVDIQNTVNIIKKLKTERVELEKIVSSELKDLGFEV